MATEESQKSLAKRKNESQETFPKRNCETQNTFPKWNCETQNTFPKWNCETQNTFPKRNCETQETFPKRNKETQKSLAKRKKIIETAERLFEKIGVEATTQRKIAEVVGMRVSNVYYYFPSKSELHKAIIISRLTAMIDAQLGLLNDARERAGGNAVPLDEILNAYAHPRLFAIANTSPKLINELISCVERDFCGKLDEATKIIHDLFDTFIEELKRTLPSVPEMELRFRLTLIESMLFGISRQLNHVIALIRFQPTKEEAGAMLRNFFLNGFSAATSRIEDFSTQFKRNFNIEK